MLDPQIGDRVVIVKEDCVFDNFVKFAELNGLEDYRSGYLPSKGETGVLVCRDRTPLGVAYGVRLDEGGTIVIKSYGVQLAK